VKIGLKTVTIAIMSAMHEENASIIQKMEIENEVTLASQTYHTGKIQGQSVVVVFSQWG